MGTYFRYSRESTKGRIIEAHNFFKTNFALSGHVHAVNSVKMHYAKQVRIEGRRRRGGDFLYSGLTGNVNFPEVFAVPRSHLGLFRRPKLLTKLPMTALQISGDCGL